MTMNNNIINVLVANRIYIYSNGVYKINEMFICSLQSNNNHDNMNLLIANNGTSYSHDCNNYALQYASRYGYYNIVELVLKNGANVHVNNDDALVWASFYGYYKIVKLLIKYGANIRAIDDNALKYASRYGNYKIVKLLIKNGANIHADHDKALKNAVEEGNYDIINLLIKNGANIYVINDITLSICYRRCNDRSKHKSLFDYYNIIMLLIEHGANMLLTMMNEYKNYYL